MKFQDCFNIFYNHDHVITITVESPCFSSATDILNQYAKYSGLERKRLTYCWSDSLTLEEIQEKS